VSENNFTFDICHELAVNSAVPSREQIVLNNCKNELNDMIVHHRERICHKSVYFLSRDKNKINVLQNEISANGDKKEKNTCLPSENFIAGDINMKTARPRLRKTNKNLYFLILVPRTIEIYSWSTVLLSFRNSWRFSLLNQQKRNPP
jgi:hypothetical protein